MEEDSLKMNWTTLKDRFSFRLINKTRIIRATVPTEMKNMTYPIEYGKLYLKRSVEPISKPKRFKEELSNLCIKIEAVNFPTSFFKRSDARYILEISPVSDSAGIKRSMNVLTHIRLRTFLKPIFMDKILRKEFQEDE